MKYEACSTFAFCPEICENTELFLIGKANRSSFIQTSGGLSSSLEPLRLPLVHRMGSSQQSVIKTRKSVQLWWEKCQSPSQAEFCPFLDMINYKAVSNKILVEFLVSLCSSHSRRAYWMFYSAKDVLRAQDSPQRSWLPAADYLSHLSTLQQCLGHMPEDPRNIKNESTRESVCEREFTTINNPQIYTVVACFLSVCRVQCTHSLDLAVKLAFLFKHVVQSLVYWRWKAPTFWEMELRGHCSHRNKYFTTFSLLCCVAPSSPTSKPSQWLVCALLVRKQLQTSLPLSQEAFCSLGKPKSFSSVALLTW